MREDHHNLEPRLVRLEERFEIFMEKFSQELSAISQDRQRTAVILKEISDELVAIKATEKARSKLLSSIGRHWWKVGILLVASIEIYHQFKSAVH